MVLSYINNFDITHIVKKIQKLIAVLSAQYAIVYASMSAAFAQSTASSLLPTTTVGGGDLMTWVQKTLNLAISLAALIAVAFLIYSGIQYILAAGDDGKIEKATKGITYSVIGLIIAFISVLIVQYVLGDVLG